MTSSMSAAVEMQNAPDIAFIGKAGACKTTAAEYLVKHHGYTRISFAAKLKDVAVQLWGPDAFKDRDKLQKLGESLRQIDDLVWVNALFRWLEGPDEPAGAGPYVIDDCRFPNEYWRLKQKGFRVVRIYAPESTRINRLQAIGKLQDIEQLKHISEVALDDYNPDQIIENQGPLVYNLYPMIEKVLDREANRI